MTLSNIVIVICIILLFLGVYSGVIVGNILDNKCKELGYDKYSSKNGLKFCEDKLGNLQTVNHDCKFKIEFMGLFPTTCYINKIKINEK